MSRLEIRYIRSYRLQSIASRILCAAVEGARTNVVDVEFGFGVDLRAERTLGSGGRSIYRTHTRDRQQCNNGYRVGGYGRSGPNHRQASC